MTKIVECHEKDFLTAYNTQMYQIKKELQELREKTSKEKMRAKNEAKIKMLEKERDWFRDEALKLDKTTNEYKQMLEKMKATLEVVEEDRNFFQDQLFNAKKFNKALNMELQKVSQKTIEPSEQPPSSENSLREDFEMNKMLLSEKPRAITNISEDYRERMNKLTLENTQLKKREAMYKETIQTLQKQEKFRKRVPGNTGTQMYDNNELKEFFLSCIEEVKKDIIKRRALSSNYSSKKYTHNKIPQVVSVYSELCAEAKRGYKAAAVYQH